MFSPNLQYWTRRGQPVAPTCWSTQVLIGGFLHLPFAEWTFPIRYLDLDIYSAVFLLSLGQFGSVLRFHMLGPVNRAAKNKLAMPASPFNPVAAFMLEPL
jgi:hypothetical protein